MGIPLYAERYVAVETTHQPHPQTDAFCIVIQQYAFSLCDDFRTLVFGDTIPQLTLILGQRAKCLCEAKCVLL